MKAKELPFLLFGLIGIAPIVLAITAGWIARALGYELDGRGPPDDSELAATLWRFGVAGWYFVYTMPLAVALSVAYALLLQLRPRIRGGRKPSGRSTCDHRGD